MTVRITTIQALRAHCAQFRASHARVALVPTMGALHAGHMKLVKVAKHHAEHVVVSIFVNPTQFGPTEDFSRYPRQEEEDAALLSAHNVDVLWLPDVAEMYQEGFASCIEVAGVSKGLCGDFRPTHFSGVATVVAKLLLQVAPDVALFGEKDYQQLCVIKRMVQDLNINCEIIGVETMREEDGLALSSRNRYLSKPQRAVAGKLNVILADTAIELRGVNINGRSFSSILALAKETILSAGFDKLDYLEWRENDTLQPVETYQSNTRLLVAAWLGNTRLIDNLEVK